MVTNNGPLLSAKDKQDAIRAIAEYAKNKQGESKQERLSSEFPYASQWVDNVATQEDPDKEHLRFQDAMKGASDGAVAFAESLKQERDFFFSALQEVARHLEGQPHQDLEGEYRMYPVEKPADTQESLNEPDSDNKMISESQYVGKLRKERNDAILRLHSIQTKQFEIIKKATDKAANLKYALSLLGPLGEALQKITRDDAAMLEGVTSDPFLSPALEDVKSFVSALLIVRSKVDQVVEDSDKFRPGHDQRELDRIREAGYKELDKRLQEAESLGDVNMKAVLETFFDREVKTAQFDNDEINSTDLEELACKLDVDGDWEFGAFRPAGAEQGDEDEEVLAQWEMYKELLDWINEPTREDPPEITDPHIQKYVDALGEGAVQNLVDGFVPIKATGIKYDHVNNQVILKMR